MGDTWFISDQHLGHKRVIEYTNRPFSCIEEMDEIIIQNHNKVVSKNDTVWFLGDFALTRKEKIREYLSRLKGKLNLVVGNHDMFLNDKDCTRLLNEICRYKEIKEYGQLYVLSHYPFYSWNKRSYGSVHIHGHCHKDIDLSIDILGNDLCNRYLCVSAECIDYTPISLEKIKRKFGIDYAAR